MPTKTKKKPPKKAKAGKKPPPKKGKKGKQSSKAKLNIAGKKAKGKSKSAKASKKKSAANGEKVKGSAHGNMTKYIVDFLSTYQTRDDLLASMIREFPDVEEEKLRDRISRILSGIRKGALDAYADKELLEKGDKVKIK